MDQKEGAFSYFIQGAFSYFIVASHNEKQI